METFWKIGGFGDRMDSPAEKAEYENLVRRFCEEEERSNRSGLLLKGERFSRPSR